MGAAGHCVAQLSRRWPRIFVGAALLFCGVALPAQADGIEVIVSPEHAGVPLDRATLRSFFTMRTRQWPDGETVHVFVLPDASDIHDEFCREQLGIYPYVLRNTWDRMVFTGTGFAPELVHSESEMKQKIKITPGAIGYIRSASKTSSLVQPKETSHEK